MLVRELIRHLLEMPMDSEIQCININDARDEFSDTSEIVADITSVGEFDDNLSAIYYIGDKRPSEDDDDDV